MIKLNWIFPILLVAGNAMAQIVVSPEKVTNVELSNRDVNRFVCQNGSIEDVYFSQEKAIVVQNHGDSSFVKFQIKNTGAGKKYISIRSEFYVVCGGVVYTLMAEPKNITGQTVYLGSGVKQEMESNLDLLAPLSHEDRILYLTTSALKDELPDSFQIKSKKRRWRKGFLKNAHVSKHREIFVEGMGLNLSEWQVRANKDQILDEAMFLKSEFGDSIAAITIEPKQVKKGEVARLFIVEWESR